VRQYDEFLQLIEQRKKEMQKIWEDTKGRFEDEIVQQRLKTIMQNHADLTFGRRFFRFIKNNEKFLPGIFFGVVGGSASIALIIAAVVFGVSSVIATYGVIFGMVGIGGIVAVTMGYMDFVSQEKEVRSIAKNGLSIGFKGEPEMIAATPSTTHAAMLASAPPQPPLGNKDSPPTPPTSTPQDPAHQALNTTSQPSGSTNKLNKKP
jgi:hypothetical protein